ncbi:MAG: DUF4382 domain-containing protein [Candidatus Hydrogenedentes bacterium]|nr:DUF4382 domain-containing protein [Candidatus Hydrogenedentota bacterium]
MRKIHMLLSCLLAVSIALMGAGCPRPAGKGKVTVLFGSDAKSLSGALLSAVAPKAVVDTADIESLTVTVTQISLDSEDEDEGETEGEGEAKAAGDVIVFEGSQDLELISLAGLSEVFSSAEIPAGTYTKIRIAIENPRLRLASDPETEITDIKLTANGHLFVSETFEVPADQNSNIEITFEDLHLVLNGNGRYVLTPQLRADILVSSADVAANGTIASVDPDNDSMVVTLADGDTTVLYAGAAIFLPADTDTPTGTEADLVVGASVDIVGTIDLDGVITATEIHLL